MLAAGVSSVRFLLLGLVLIPMAGEAVQCTAQSGPRTAALVELYTSKGCSSCPSADRWLSGLAGRYPTASLVALALHVDYWDYVDSKGPYGKRELVRQRKLTQLQRTALVYTPQVLLQGRDFGGWAGKAFDDALARINAQPARASLRLAILEADAEGLEVEASALLLQPPGDAALYMAAYQNRLQKEVVLEWQGPFEFAGIALNQRRKLALLPGAAAADSGVAAFVQDRRTGEVLQALLRSYC